jgi:hypothetical protein
MAHSNKPQPEVFDGPYFQDCEAAAEMSEEALYWEEVNYQEGAVYDQYDGHRLEDLSNEGAWENEEAEAAAGLVLPPPPRPVVAPQQPLSDDDILF